MNKWIQTLALLTLSFALTANECADEVAVEKTFTMIKPNAIAKDQIHDILGVYAKNGLRVVQTKRVQLSQEEAEQFYAEHKGKPYFDDLLSFITSGPILAVELEGPHAVAKARELIGATDPEKAAEGTIRKLYGDSVTANAVHGSDSIESATRELSFFFN